MEQIVKNRFKADYASRKPEERLALADKLLKQGGETADDPTSTYVLLRESIGVASGLGDVDIAMKALD